MYSCFSCFEYKLHMKNKSLLTEYFFHFTANVNFNLKYSKRFEGWRRTCQNSFKYSSQSIECQGSPFLFLLRVLSLSIQQPVPDWIIYQELSIRKLSDGFKKLYRIPWENIHKTFTSNLSLTTMHLQIERSFFRVSPGSPYFLCFVNIPDKTITVWIWKMEELV